MLAERFVRVYIIDLPQERNQMSDEKEPLTTYIAPSIAYMCFDHLPEGPLRQMSQAFFSLAIQVCVATEPGPMQDQALSDLRRAKDAAVNSIVVSNHPDIGARVNDCIKLALGTEAE
jgi:hypothetical protein